MIQADSLPDLALLSRSRRSTIITTINARDVPMLSPAGYTLPEAAPQCEVIVPFVVRVAAAIGLIGWMVRQDAFAVTKTRQSAATRA